MPLRAESPLFRYADTLVNYTQGPGAQPGYTTPGVALGPPSVDHSPLAPLNNDPNTGAPLVVSLGQRGSITLSFSTPVRNQIASARNPYGYDLLVWGNPFQGGAAITFEGEFGRFQEQGFIEVAQAGPDGEPVEWFLILPRIFHDAVPGRGGPVPRDFPPADLLMWFYDPANDLFVSGDLSISSSRFDGLADAVPARGSALSSALAINDPAGVVLDDPQTYDIEGLGGTGVDLFRAVRQASPGVPRQTLGQFEFAYPTQIDLIRITDARGDDMNPGAAGPVTTEVDGVIVLPDLRDCHHPFADADADGDVDLDDFGIFQHCITGSGTHTTTPDCACFDRDGDGDVDAAGPAGSTDLHAFQQCMTRAGVPADPECE